MTSDLRDLTRGKWRGEEREKVRQTIAKSKSNYYNANHKCMVNQVVGSKCRSDRKIFKWSVTCVSCVNYCLPDVPANVGQRINKQVENWIRWMSRIFCVPLQIRSCFPQFFLNPINLQPRMYLCRAGKNNGF